MNCVRCNSAVPDSTVYFCGQCGAAQLSNILIKEKTTAGYDPFNRNYKPWRETPSLAPQPSRAPITHLTKPNIGPQPYANSVPWRPAMRQPHRVVRSKKVSSSSSLSSLAADTSQSTEPSREELINEMRKQEGVLVFQGQVFQKSTKYYQPSRNTGAARRHTNQQAKADLANLTRQSIEPLAIYELTWLPLPGYYASVSLVDSFDGTKSRLTLRVSIYLEDDVLGSAGEGDSHQNSTQPESQSTGGNHQTTRMKNLLHFYKNNLVADETHVVANITNDIARLMVPPSCDWVDLIAINPHEYYIVAHMQLVLHSIAGRLKFDHLSRLAQFDQVTRVSTIRLASWEQVISSDLKLNKTDAIIETLFESYLQVKLTHEAVLDSGSSFSGVGDLSDDDDFDPQQYVLTQSQPSILSGFIYLDTTIAEKACKIQMGKLSRMQFMMATARLSARYYSSTSRAPKESLHFLSHVNLMVFPSGYLDFPLGIKVLSFDIRSVQLLTDIEDVMAFLATGRHAANELLRALTSLLVLEHTSRGYKLCVKGVANQSRYRVIAKWPGDVEPAEEVGADSEDRMQVITEPPSEIEDNEEQRPVDSMTVAATRHQIAITIAATMKIQCFLRQFLARRRVYHRRRAILEAEEIAEKAAEIAAAMPPPCLLHDDGPCSCIILTTIIKGSTVEVVGQFHRTKVVETPNSEKDAEEDKWHLEIVLADALSDLRTSLVVEVEDLIELFHFLLDQIQGGVDLIEELLTDVGPRCRSYNQQSLLEANISQASHVIAQSSNEIDYLSFSLGDMIADRSSSAALLVLATKGIDLFLSRSQRIMRAKYSVGILSKTYLVFQSEDGEEIAAI